MLMHNFNLGNDHILFYYAQNALVILKPTLSYAGHWFPLNCDFIVR